MVTDYETVSNQNLVHYFSKELQDLQQRGNPRTLFSSSEILTLKKHGIIKRVGGSHSKLRLTELGKYLLEEAEP